MYIVAIGWLWVVLMMALTESSVTAGILTLLLYGLAPLALFLWLAGTPARRKRLADQAVDQKMGEVDRGDAGRDQ
jgi:membrane protein implicated in regulation of membrane protease activity